MARSYTATPTSDGGMALTFRDVSAEPCAQCGAPLGDTSRYDLPEGLFHVACYEQRARAAAAQPKTVGQFTYNPSDQTLSGPTLYMQEQGNARLARILSGRDELYNANAHRSPDVITAILVWMQTDYAGWYGFKSFRTR